MHRFLTNPAWTPIDEHGQEIPVNAIFRTFKRPRVLLPVVHCEREGQARRAVDVAMAHGADGVFIINQGGMQDAAVLRMAERLVAEGHPFVGLNLRGESVASLFQDAAMTRLHGVWADSAGIRVVDDAIDGREAIEHRTAREEIGYAGLYFGGVAFKYQRPVERYMLAPVALSAVNLGIDVVATSGDAPGKPPAVEKIAAMREAIGDHALAIASGITPDNAASYLAANAFLVATGIEEKFGVFDPARVKALADVIHGGT